MYITMPISCLLGFSNTGRRKVSSYIHFFDRFEIRIWHWYSLHSHKKRRVCNSVMYIIARMKCHLDFFHDTGCSCSGFFHPPARPQDVCIMNVGWVISSKNEFYWKRIVVWSQFLTYNLVNPATIWGKRPKLTINIANLSKPNSSWQVPSRELCQGIQVSTNYCQDWSVPSQVWWWEVF